MTYAKPHLTYNQQLKLLKSRGVSCDDDSYAIRLLRNNGYYNVSGYLYPFRLPGPAGTGKLDSYAPGTTIKGVAQLMEFDRSLRITLLNGIQLVEIAIRASSFRSHSFSSVIYHLS